MLLKKFYFTLDGDMRKMGFMIEIREMITPDDNVLKECLRIMWETQGENITQFDWLKNMVTSQESMLLVAYDGDKVVGAAGAKLLSTGFEFYLPFGEKFVKEMEKAKVGSLSIMGLEPLYQNKGIGQRMACMRQEWLIKNGCNLLVGVSWVSGMANTSNRVFEKLGFKNEGQVDTLFEEMSYSMNLICPVCGKPPCRCPSILYIKRI